MGTYKTNTSIAATYSSTARPPSPSQENIIILGRNHLAAKYRPRNAIRGIRCKVRQKKTSEKTYDGAATSHQLAATSLSLKQALCRGKESIDASLLRRVVKASADNASRTLPKSRLDGYGC